MKSIKERGQKYRDTRLAAVQAQRDEWMLRALAAEEALKNATPAPASQLPQFIRAEVERAIAKAVAPTGMSAHSGMAVIGHDKLRYMLALIDKLAATPAPAQGRRVGVVRLGERDHPYAVLESAFDEHGEHLKDGAPLYTAPQAAAPAPAKGQGSP